MRKFKDMDDWKYFKAMDEFMARYNAPTCEPIKMLHLVISREEADEILKGKRKVIVRPFSDAYFHCLTDHNVDEWMTANRDSFGMDMEAFKEFMCATRPVLKLHLHDKHETWSIDTTCVENALIRPDRKNVQDMNKRYQCMDMNRLVMEVENKSMSKDSDLYYYFVIGEILKTEKDIPQNEATKIVEMEPLRKSHLGNYTNRHKKDEDTNKVQTVHLVSEHHSQSRKNHAGGD